MAFFQVWAPDLELQEGQGLTNMTTTKWFNVMPSVYLEMWTKIQMIKDLTGKHQDIQDQ